MPKTAVHQPLLFISKYSLLLLTFIFISVCYAIWQYWPDLILSSMRWQRGIYEQLSELLYNAREHIVTVSISLAGLSFLYGALHSLGPGHGKLIVTTYLATHPTKVKMSLVLTILSALLQAVVAIVLVSILLLVFNSSMREVNDNANYFITLSFYIVILLGVFIVWRNLRSTWSLFFSKSEDKSKPEHNHNHHDHDHDHAHDHAHEHSHDHQHSEDCGCGHKHFVEADLINQASSFKEYLVIILSIGVRPCTGAVMVLLFANMAGIYWLGVVSAFVMAIGTALTTSTIAIMTITGKQIIKRYLTTNHSHSSTENTNKSALMGICCRLSGGILLILVGFLLISSQPVGMSPIL